MSVLKERSAPGSLLPDEQDRQALRRSALSDISVADAINSVNTDRMRFFDAEDNTLLRKTVCLTGHSYGQGLKVASWISRPRIL